MISVVVVVVLQDAADKQEMDRPTSKNLNFCLAAIAAGNASALWSAPPTLWKCCMFTQELS